MAELNYFQILSLSWAALGIGSSLLMITFGERWNEWKLQTAYRKEKPKWVYFIAVAGFAIIVYTWYSVFVHPVDYGWIFASFISLTAIKLFALLFQYDKFRQFVETMLNDKRKMTLLNGAVVAFSFVWIAMAFFLY